MITGEGGLVHRIMPPVDWDCGPIPAECYNPSLTTREIENILRPVYLDEQRIKKLANSDDPSDYLQAHLALETLIEIDANTIWAYNLVNVNASKRI